MGDEEDEEESDAIVTQVLDELGLQLTDQLTAVPIAGGSIAAPGAAKKTAVAAAEVKRRSGFFREKLSA
jgi:charged multivesicular body protein 2A